MAHRGERGPRQFGDDESSTRLGSVPAKLSLNMRPKAAAGFAADAEAVNQ